jgi:hypothetical protein
MQRVAAAGISLLSRAAIARRRVLTRCFSLAAVALVTVGVAAASSVPFRDAMAEAAPSARVGAFYFDGWACPLSNFHFKNLVGGPYAGRRPLYGWRDNTVESMRTQLSWARQDGISFFVFDWFREGIDPCLNVAHDNYLALHDHQGVGFALMFVNNDIFNVPLDQLPAVADKWATRDFLNPDYVRINGKPLLIIYETQEAMRGWGGGAAGVNRAIAIIQQAAKDHGLPGVFIVGGRQDYWDYSVGCVLTCGYDGDLIDQNYDALSKYTFNLDVQPVDGPIPYSRLVTAEEANWQRYANQRRFPYIPSVAGGWDPRPADERPEGHLFWFKRSPQEFGAFLRDAIAWVQTHPSMRVEPAPAPPLVLIEAWNELAEGAQVLPTVQDGYAYGRAVANALGMPWHTLHRRHITITDTAHRTVTGTVAVDDQWTPCEMTRLHLQHHARRHWATILTTSTNPGGSFSFRLTTRAGSYRISAPPTIRYRQRCGAATSGAVTSP